MTGRTIIKMPVHNNDTPIPQTDICPIILKSLKELASFINTPSTKAIIAKNAVKPPINLGSTNLSFIILKPLLLYIYNIYELT